MTIPFPPGFEPPPTWGDPWWQAPAHHTHVNTTTVTLTGDDDGQDEGLTELEANAAQAAARIVILLAAAGLLWVVSNDLGYKVPFRAWALGLVGLRAAVWGVLFRIKIPG